MHPSPASISRRRAARHERAWRRIRRPLKLVLLIVNPLYMVGYVVGERLPVLWAMIAVAVTAPALMCAVAAIPQFHSIASSTIAIESLVLLAGAVGGILRRNLRQSFEIYYLSTTSGRVSAFSLFCSSTYLHGLVALTAL